MNELLFIIHESGICKLFLAGLQSHLCQSSHRIRCLLVLVLVQRAQGFPAQLQITHRIVALDGLVQVGVKGHLSKLSRRIREVSWFFFNHLVPMKIAIFGRIDKSCHFWTPRWRPGRWLKKPVCILVERPEHYPSLSESFKILKSYEQW